jgi:hypothetical protein
MKSLTEVRKKLRSLGMNIFPDKTRVVGNLGTTVLPAVNNGKEYIAGFFRAKQGNVAQEKAAFSKRNEAAKYLRENGFQTWTEPKSHMGGTDTCEFYLSSMRKKS